MMTWKEQLALLGLPEPPPLEERIAELTVQNHSKPKIGMPIHVKAPARYAGAPITYTPFGRVDFTWTEEDFARQRELLKDAAKQTGINTEGLFDR